MKTLLTIIGTRPEAIKLAPVIYANQENERFKNLVCVTQQHTDLLNPFLKDLEIKPHFYFPAKEGGSLQQSFAYMLKELEKTLKTAKPDLVLVQGDTTTAFVGALGAHYSNIPVAHIEAGLRTGDLQAPWPEETHRRLIDQLSSYFFVPTQTGKENLLKEGILPEKIWVVGNTSIDAVRIYKDRLSNTSLPKKKSIVVTVHRRENHGKPLEAICNALLKISQNYPSLDIFFFMHPNPAVQKVVQKKLSRINNIFLKNPSDHFTFLDFLLNASFILTDSGGIQEEAPYVGTPVLVARNTTERPEGIRAGTARLVGTCPNSIISHCTELLENDSILSSMSKVHSPYGLGYSGEKIISILSEALL